MFRSRRSRHTSLRLAVIAATMSMLHVICDLVCPYMFCLFAENAIINVIIPSGLLYIKTLQNLGWTSIQYIKKIITKMLTNLMCISGIY